MIAHSSMLHKSQILWGLFQFSIFSQQWCTFCTFVLLSSKYTVKLLLYFNIFHKHICIQTCFMEKTQKSRKTWAPASYALHILKGGLTLVILEICIISIRIYRQKKISTAILNYLPTKCANSTDIQGQILHKSKY